jgi:hypothetical protein
MDPVMDRSPGSALLLLLLPLAAGCWRSTDATEPAAAPVAAPAPRPGIPATWRGICGPPSSGWRVPITAQLSLSNDGDVVVATGTLVFASRRTRARLRGPRSRGGRHTLHGHMTEVGGLGTRWEIILEVEPGAGAIRGRFLEVLEAGGEQEMCRFMWMR